jgi:hypothetical protein
MRRQVEAAGFRVDSQRRIFRLPAVWTLPSVLTQATRPAATGDEAHQMTTAHADA